MVLVRVAKWITDELDNKMLFRRLIIIYAGVFIYHATLWSFQLAMASLHTDKSGAEISMIIGAVLTLPVGLTAFLYREYSKCKSTR